MGDLLDELIAMIPNLASTQPRGPHTVNIWNEELPLEVWECVTTLGADTLNAKCKCDKIQAHAPSTKNSLGHLILRHEIQYEEVFTPQVA